MTHNQLGNLQLVSQYLTVLGSLALALHDTGQAREILRSSLTLAKKLSDIPTQIWVLSVLTGIYVPLRIFMSINRLCGIFLVQRVLLVICYGFTDKIPLVCAIFWIALTCDNILFHCNRYTYLKHC